MSEVKPALTAEQWAYVERFGAAPSPLPDAAGDVLIEGGADRQAVAALALHGQPFGFSWADVDELDHNIRYLEAGAPGNEPQMRSIRDRIAALLPPREEAK